MANDVSITIGTDTSAAKAGFKEIDNAVDSSTSHAGKLTSAIGDIGKIAGGIIAAQGITAIGGALKGAFTDAVTSRRCRPRPTQ